MAKKESAAPAKEKVSFVDWWNSSEAVKIWVGRAYAIGAAIVIVGALFKIMHFPGAGVMLCVGMGTEVLLFLIGVLDKPHEVYHWDKVFPQLTQHGDAESHDAAPVAGGVAAPVAGASSASVLSEEDAKRLSDGVSSVVKTAERLASISDVVGSMDAFKKSVDAASAETDKYAQMQGTLNTSAEKLSGAYVGIAGDVEQVVAQTKNQLAKVEAVNKSLDAINSVYELQLNELRAQQEVVAAQAAGVNAISASVNGIGGELNKVQSLLETAVVEEESFNKGVQELNAKVSNLNNIYGNMLNALS